jgi:hypothetical protein
MGNRGKTEEGKTKRKVEGVRRSMTEGGLTEDDDRDRDMWRNLAVGEGRLLYIGQIL